MSSSRLLRYLASFEGYLHAAKAKGIYVYDDSGRRYVDACSSNFSVAVGHGVEEIAGAIREQAGRLTMHPPMCTSEPAEELADLLIAGAPSGWFSHVSFCNSGSEAVETAIKLALQWHWERGEGRRRHVIVRDDAYHGFTGAAMAATGHPSFRDHGGWETLVARQPRIAAPNASRSTDHGAELEAMIERLGAHSVAAFLAEPIGGAMGGASVPPPGYWAAIRSVCDRHGVLVIADEVLTGFGRTGATYALEDLGARPDLCAVGKGLAGGYAPLAAVMIAPGIVETLARGSGIFPSTGTFHRHPLACAAGLAVRRYAARHGLDRRAGELHATLQHRLSRMADEIEGVRAVRGKGLLWAIELEGEADGVLRGPQLAPLLALQRRGVLLTPGTHPRRPRLMLAPPLLITEAELGELLDSLEASLTETSPARRAFSGARPSRAS